MRDFDDIGRAEEHCHRQPSPAAAAGHQCCEWPECGGEAAYRAPRSASELRNFRWFCLEHIRAYNQRWDFFADMSAAEIEAYRRADYTWHRPTWPLGIGPVPEGFDLASAKLRDGYGLFGGGTGKPPRRALNDGDRALAELDLEATATVDEVKARYKVLAKRHHPDANGGDRRSEERLKKINQAYTYLMTNGLPGPL